MLIAPIVITLHTECHSMYKGRQVLVGECLPASCDVTAVERFASQAESAAAARAAAAGLAASLHTVSVRPVPGDYNLYADRKFHIIGSVVLAVIILMIAASLYEGYLERRFRIENGAADLEVAHDDNHKNDRHFNKLAVEVPMLLKSFKCSATRTDFRPLEKGPLRSKTPANVHVDGKFNEDKDKELRREPCGMWAELLLAFSILTNGRTILSTQKPSDGALTCLHGIRGLLVTVLFLRSEDRKTKKIEQPDKPDINKNVNGYTNSALSISVISQQSFKEDLLDKPKSTMYSKMELFRMIKSFFVLFFYRVIRLTPAYAFVIGITEVSFRYIYNQAVFDPAVPDHIICDLFWWRNLLYINNLYTQREMCMVWSWYMANDTQFYVVGIILLLISVKNFKLATVSLFVIMVSSWGTTIYISVWHQYKAKIQEPFEMFDPLYDKPWSRIGPYLIGQRYKGSPQKLNRQPNYSITQLSSFSLNIFLDLEALSVTSINFRIFCVADMAVNLHD
ncbi:unnamed protein product [Diatraea saccharalis]|uniref:Uncharacterized protein n=1 Tax=Diatraea saccharalis TaxID=40085 RepID=A0A9N9QTR7_9NEOP|nr:unnamed protein product [Diatraea saccharalis]